MSASLDEFREREQEKRRRRMRLLVEANRLLRRWRRRAADLGLPENDPDPRLFSETGMLCAELEQEMGAIVRISDNQNEGL